MRVIECIMEGASSSSRPASHDDTHGGYSPNASPNIRPDDGRYKSSAVMQNENRAPVPILTALNSMLKTTTEIGDVGQFAVKPSHLPPPRKPIGTQSGYTLQKPQQTIRLPNRQQTVDDRRRLPSYARDASSKAISLYDTAGQKTSSSPRGFEPPDHRSYSMTQTSYSSSALSNHRSYASLRSQPELGLLPRPRSPFLYPARLKRLGFRPSSPTLTEGGRIDSVKNAEFEYAMYATGIRARSASPVNAYRTPPRHFTQQLNANKTDSYLLGRLPSGNRHYSLSPKSTTKSTEDWGFHSELASAKALPASSNIKSSSMPVQYHRRSTNTFAATKSKSHTPSPLFYDYTEDFNVEEAYDGEDAAGDNSSPVPFILNKTTYKGGEIIPEASPQYNSSPRRSSTIIDVHASVTLSKEDSPEPSDEKPRLDNKDDHGERSIDLIQDIVPLYPERRPYDRIGADPIINKTFPGSVQSVGAQDGSLSSNGNANNGFSPDLLDAIDKKSVDFNSPQHLENKESHDQKNKAHSMSMSDRTSSFRLSTYLPDFPKPPDQTIQVVADGYSTARGQEAPVMRPDSTTSEQEVREYPIQSASEGLGYGSQLPASREFQHDLSTATIQRSATTYDRRTRSSGYYSIDQGLTELAQLVSNFEFANGSFTSQDVYTQSTEATTRLSEQPSPALTNSRMPKDSQFSPEVLLQSSSLVESSPPMNRFRSEGDLRAASSKPFNTSNHALNEGLINVDDRGKESRESVSYYNSASHPTAWKPLRRSKPPLFAPKAVSPARVLKLKNSVPQLMKALPPVPRNPTCGNSSLRQSSARNLLSASHSLDLEHRKILADIEPVQGEAAFIESIPSQQDFEDATELGQTFPRPPKFRIRSKLFAAQRADSPTSSRPWNLDESYPWYGQQPTIRLSSLRSMIPGIQGGSKFKLRVTRASTSPSGTIRINPEARSSLDLGSPRDLFTSSSNLSEIFRQVSRQFSSRKPSDFVGTAPGNGTQAPLVVLVSTQASDSCEHNPDLLGPLLSHTRAAPANPTEVRSFFSEDSSQIRGHNGLRKRISNLRARIPNPYTSRPATHFNDNEACREHVAPHAPTKGKSRANCNVDLEDEYGMPIASFRHHKLGSKVSRWFKDAGSAMRRHVKLRNSDDVRCIPHK